MNGKIVAIGFLFLMVLVALGCGRGEADEDTSTREDISWDAIQPIVNLSCGGSGSSCHNNSIASSGINYENISETAFVDTNPLSRIQDSNDPMPPTDDSKNPNGLTLSASDKLTLVKYLSLTLQ